MMRIDWLELRGVFCFPFTDLNALNKQPQQFRCQRINCCVLLCLFNESIHVRFARLKLCQTLFFLRNLFLQHTLLVCVIAGEHPVLLVCHAPENIVLIEPFEQLGQLCASLFHCVQFTEDTVHLLPQFCAVFLVDVRRELPLLHSGEIR